MCSCGITISSIVACLRYLSRKTGKSRIASKCCPLEVGRSGISIGLVARLADEESALLDAMKILKSLELKKI